jgi:signal transduction histidine kinase
LLVRAGPFAAIAVLAEASLGLPPGPASAGAAAASVVLLLVAAAAFLLPWPRLPAWMPVLVPLAYTGSVLALILAAGSASGVSIVILVPLVWTALFQRLWESECIVAAIVAVQVVISLAPMAVPAAVIVRRVILWAALGAVISVAAHGLRDRIALAQEQAAQLQDRLREVSIIEDRDRIAENLRDRVIHRIFAAGLALQSAAMRTTDEVMRRRIGKAIDDLDRAVLILRDTVFGLERDREGCGLRDEILCLCRELNLAPELSFTGPVDGALRPGARAVLVELLREALGAIGQHFVPARIGITAADDWYTAVIEAAPLAGDAGMKSAAPGLFALRNKAAQAGVGIDIEPGPDSTRFAWHVPLGPPHGAG